MEIINYIYFRIYKHYKNDNFTASIYITVIQIAIMFFIIMSFNALFFPKRLLVKDFFSFLSLSMNERKIFSLFGYVILHLVNYIYFKNKVKNFKEKFKNYYMNNWFRLWMLFLLVFLLIAFPILIFKIKN